VAACTVNCSVLAARWACLVTRCTLTCKSVCVVYVSYVYVFVHVYVFVVICCCVFPCFWKKIKDHKKYKIPKKSFLDVSQEAKKKCFFFPLLLNNILIYNIY
jgi:hypothetical protein